MAVDLALIDYIFFCNEPDLTNILFKMQSFFQGDQALKSYKDQADSYICSVLPESPYFKIPMTPGLFCFSMSLLHF